MVWCDIACTGARRGDGHGHIHHHTSPLGWTGATKALNNLCFLENDCGTQDPRHCYDEWYLFALDHFISRRLTAYHISLKNCIRCRILLHSIDNKLVRIYRFTYSMSYSVFCTHVNVHYTELSPTKTSKYWPMQEGSSIKVSHLKIVNNGVRSEDGYIHTRLYVEDQSNPASFPLEVHHYQFYVWKGGACACMHVCISECSYRCLLYSYWRFWVGFYIGMYAW